MFRCECCKIFENGFLYKTPPVAVLNKVKTVLGTPTTPTGKKTPDPKPNPIPNLTLTLPLTPHGGLFSEGGRGGFPDTSENKPK